MPRRLSRAEKQAHTRSCLMEAAERIFSRRGLERGSIDEVAQEAGYTKGAFYANFKNKQELFLAMLDQRFADRLEEVDRATHSEGDPPEQARQAAREFIRALSADEEWERLFFEFAAYAMRNEDFHEELATRRATLRARMTEIYRRRLEELDFEPPFPVEQMAAMSFAMAEGIALSRMLDPGLVTEELYASLLEAFFTGVGAMAEARDAGVTPGS